jgi:hypothetical protein
MSKLAPSSCPWPSVGATTLLTNWRALDIAIMENGRGDERKINGEPATPILVADREGRLKQNLRKMDGSLTYIFFTGPLNVM